MNRLDYRAYTFSSNPSRFLCDFFLDSEGGYCSSVSAQRTKHLRLPGDKLRDDLFRLSENGVLLAGLFSAVMGARETLYGGCLFVEGIVDARFIFEDRMEELVRFIKTVHEKSYRLKLIYREEFENCGLDKRDLTREQIDAIASVLAVFVQRHINYVIYQGGLEESTIEWIDFCLTSQGLRWDPEIKEPLNTVYNVKEPMCITLIDENCVDGLLDTWEKEDMVFYESALCYVVAGQGVVCIPRGYSESGQEYTTERPVSRIRFPSYIPDGVFLRRFKGYCLQDVVGYLCFLWTARGLLDRKEFEAGIVDNEPVIIARSFQAIYDVAVSRTNNIEGGGGKEERHRPLVFGRERESHIMGMYKRGDVYKTEPLPETYQESLVSGVGSILKNIDEVR